MRSISGPGIFRVFAVVMKHHVGEIVVDLEIVIVEGHVLLGVEDLKQRR